jgi:peptidoglycan/xylan/chitin deacetylase (PgdA/CDA1 family)
VCAVLFVLAGLLAAALPGVAQASPADDPVVYFPETGHHVPRLFLDAWHDFGGLPILGYPISETLEREGLTVQYFERAIMEWHPQHGGTRYEVQLALLGNWKAEGRRDESAFVWMTEPAGSSSLVTYFSETGHHISNGFKTYWEQHGGLPLFGYPISEEFLEGDYVVQYFERARFEWHPEHRSTVHEVLLGHLGRDAASAHGIDTASVAQRPDAHEYGQNVGVRSLDIPVLMYHELGYPDSRYTIGQERFARQLDWLQRNGYTPVTVTQVYDYIDGFGSLPSKPIVLMFDDGPVSQMDAAAALDARGMVGVFFIHTRAHMSDDQIRSLAERGHEIGAHSISHPFLTRLSDDALWAEVYENKIYLESVIGRRVDFFAYPFGDWDKRVAATVERAGYRGALHAWGGRHWSPEKRWHEPRIEIDGTMSLERFIYFVEQFG